MLGAQAHPCLVCMVHLKGSHIFLNSLASFQREDELSFLHRGPQTSLTDEDFRPVLNSSQALTCQCSWGN